MSDLRALTNHLTAWAREELRALVEYARALGAQAEAAAHRDPTLLERASAELLSLTEAAAERELRRRALFEAFAAAHGVPASMTTLGSIAHRLGEDGAAISELRVELRAAAARVAAAHRRTRRVLALHRSVTREVLDTLLSHGGRSPLDSDGVLVNAEV